MYKLTQKTKRHLLTDLEPTGEQADLLFPNPQESQGLPELVVTSGAGGSDDCAGL